MERGLGQTSGAAMKVLGRIMGGLLFAVVGTIFVVATFAIGSTVAAIDSIPRKRHIQDVV